MISLRLQSIRFAAVGFASNAVLYLFYLLITWLGLSPSAAVTAVFFLGAVQTFLLNKSWTFSVQRHSRVFIIRYFFAYGAAYFVNIFALYVFVDGMAFNHRFVQAVAVIVIGALLFFIQRNWVFMSLNREKSDLVR